MLQNHADEVLRESTRCKIGEQLQLWVVYSWLCHASRHGFRVNVWWFARISDTGNLFHTDASDNPKRTPLHWLTVQSSYLINIIKLMKKINKLFLMQFWQLLTFNQTWKHCHSLFSVSHKLYLVILLMVSILQMRYFQLDNDLLCSNFH